MTFDAYISGKKITGSDGTIHTVENFYACSGLNTGTYSTADAPEGYKYLLNYTYTSNEYWDTTFEEFVSESQTHNNN